MKILIADQFDEGYRQHLQENGHEICFEPSLTADDIPARISDYQALIVRSTKVSRAVIEGAVALELIIRAGAGTNTIDVDAAAERGIFVCNTPGRNAIAVAELAMGLLIAVDRQIPANVMSSHAGRWDKKAFSKADGLAGKKIGIVGFGQIGQAFAVRARAFDLECYTLDRGHCALYKSYGVKTWPDLAAMAARVDILSLHVPMNAHTNKLINAEILQHCASNMIVINTSRGGVIDEEALLEAIESKGLRAGIDVYAEEPSTSQGDFNNHLAIHPRVVGTHHIGASTAQAQRAIAGEVMAIIDDFGNGRVRHCVNMETMSTTESTLIIRHYDRVGVLATVLTVLKNAGINVEEMSNRIFKGACAAYAVIATDSAISAAVVDEVSALPDIIHVSMRD